MKQRGILMGATAITKGKDSKPLDLCIVKIAMKDPEGNGWQIFEFMRGKAADAHAINGIVNATPKWCDCDLELGKDYRTGGLTMKLINYIVIKDDGKSPFA